MFEIHNDLIQSIVLTLGAGSIYMISSQASAARRVGAIIGLVGQPFWLYTAGINEQWGIAILSFVYIYSFIMILFSDRPKPTFKFTGRTPRVSGLPNCYSSHSRFSATDPTDPAHTTNKASSVLDNPNPAPVAVDPTPEEVHVSTDQLAVLILLGFLKNDSE